MGVRTCGAGVDKVKHRVSTIVIRNILCVVNCNGMRVGVDNVVVISTTTGGVVIDIDWAAVIIVIIILLIIWIMDCLINQLIFWSGISPQNKSLRPHALDTRTTRW